MLNKSKRILALTLCILLVMLSLAACRRADGDGDTSGTGDVSAVQPGGNETGGMDDDVIGIGGDGNVSGSTTQGDKDGNGGTTNKVAGTKKPTTGVDDDTIDLGKGTTTTTTTTTAKPDNNSNGDQGGNNTTTSTSAPAVAKDPQLDNNDNWVKNPNPV